jgi:hypothetical protein
LQTHVGPIHHHVMLIKREHTIMHVAVSLGGVQLNGSQVVLLCFCLLSLQERDETRTESDTAMEYFLHVQQLVFIPLHNMTSWDPWTPHRGTDTLARTQTTCSVPTVLPCINSWTPYVCVRRSHYKAVISIPGLPCFESSCLRSDANCFHVADGFAFSTRSQRNGRISCASLASSLWANERVLDWRTELFSPLCVSVISAK